jgi:hypothetical protein
VPGHRLLRAVASGDDRLAVVTVLAVYASGATVTVI